jgi:mannose-6-phosphate isomerase-like protein (cupin superfamily)
MKHSHQQPLPHIDPEAWGEEVILQVYPLTVKILKPHNGRRGCLSLQRHDLKSEVWYMAEGVAWSLVIMGNEVYTRILRPGDVQLLPTGTPHRLMGIEKAKIFEASTPDLHASDKTAPKDVVRLHCVLGRAIVSPETEEEARVINLAIQYTEEAIAALEEGQLPEEYLPRKGISGNMFSVDTKSH